MSKNQECSGRKKHVKKARAPSPRTPLCEDNRQLSADEHPMLLVNSLPPDGYPPPKRAKCKIDLNEVPGRVAKLVIAFLGVSSLDSTNLCAVFPALASYRSEVLTDYYNAIHSRHNRGTGFLSPDHCRTPILSKPEESLYDDIQMLKSHRRLCFGDD